MIITATYVGYQSGFSPEPFGETLCYTFQILCLKSASIFKLQNLLIHEPAFVLKSAESYAYLFIILSPAIQWDLLGSKKV